MRHRRKSLAQGVVALAALGAMVLAAAGPASATGAGAQTGWEYSNSAANASGCGLGLPQSGFPLLSDQFVLTSTAPFANVMTIDIGANVAAPQGAAPGGCGANSDPLVPGPIPITTVSITGAGACSSAGGTFLRVNSTVAFTFTCGGSTYVIAGNLNICQVPVGPFTTVPNPECAADGNASGHLVTTYAGT